MERAREIGRGFAEAANHSGLTNPANRKPDEKSLKAKKLKAKEQRPAREKKVKQGPWMSRRDQVNYRKFVAPTKSKRVKVDRKWEVQEPEEAIEYHKLIWPLKGEDLHLRVAIEDSGKEQIFPLLRFPEAQDEVTNLAEFIANLLYDKKTWRHFVLTIKEAIAKLEQGKTVVIPMNKKAFIEDLEQDMG